MSTVECERAPAGRVKVLLWCRYENDADLAEIGHRFERIGELLRGTPGLLCSELLVSLSTPGSCVVLSEWASDAEFEAWERGSEHRGQTAEMRPFQDDQREPVFDVLSVFCKKYSHDLLVHKEECAGAEGSSDALH